MSRISHKDKYETNNRRTHTFMTAEDVAAGKKPNWSELEISGNFKFYNNLFIAKA